MTKLLHLLLVLFSLVIVGSAAVFFSVLAIRAVQVML